MSNYNKITSTYRVPWDPPTQNLCHLGLGRNTIKEKEIRALWWSRRGPAGRNQNASFTAAWRYGRRSKSDFLIEFLMGSV
ncbi:hypothetical protein SUGI_0645190 [Cryptomeria japonica]|nr:hypothetical protein SUGI_0645190 [Cryptomeria japonica]